MEDLERRLAVAERKESFDDESVDSEVGILCLQVRILQGLCRDSGHSMDRGHGQLVERRVACTVQVVMTVGASDSSLSKLSPTSMLILMISSPCKPETCVSHDHWCTVSNEYVAPTSTL